MAVSVDDVRAGFERAGLVLVRAAGSGADGATPPSRTAFRPVKRAEPNAFCRDSHEISGWVNRNTTTRSSTVDRPNVNAKPFTSPAAK